MSRRREWAYVKSVLSVALCTGIAALVPARFERANLIMVYLVGVMAVAVTSGRGPAVLAAALSVASFDFFFVPPHGTLAVSNPQSLLTFAMMLLAALVIATLASRLKAQVQTARIDEHRAEALARLSRDLLALEDRDRIAAAARRRLEEVFESRAAILLPDRNGRLAIVAGDPGLLGPDARAIGVAQWAFDNGQPAGIGTSSLPTSDCLHLPLHGATRELGVIAIAATDVDRLLAADRFRLLEAFAGHIALAIERADLAHEAGQARAEREAERLRSGLLSSVSHDLRTPLAVITGAATTLLESGGAVRDGERRDMLRSIADEAARLNRLVGNLLAMTRLQAGALEVRRGWHPIEEIIGAALHRIEPQVGHREVRVDLPPHLPLVAVDDVLIEQLLFNLVENALQHAPASDIELRVRITLDALDVCVADRGPGLPPGGEERLFEAFHRGHNAGPGRGAGLGLAICRGIVAAHGGRLEARPRAGGGAEFVFTLPLDANPPGVEPESGDPGDPGVVREATS